MTIGAVGGAATAWTGGGAVLGALAVYHGSDVLVSGIRQMSSGETTQTLTEKSISSGLQRAGVRKEKAELATAYADGAIRMFSSFGSGFAKSNVVVANLTRPIIAKAVTKLSPFELEITHGLTKSKTAFTQLKADIKLNGMKDPIKFIEHNGKRFVVDSHHR